MKKILLILLIFLSGCIYSRSIYLPSGQAVQLRKSVKNVKVWVLTEDKEKVPSIINLEEGGYYVPNVE